MDLLDDVNVAGEARHPWEKRRAAFFLAILRGAVEGRRSFDVLDCGAGDAFFANEVRTELPGVRSVACWDTSYDADMLRTLGARYPSLGFYRSRPESSFEVCLMLDVLEHVDDDVAFARSIVESSVAPGGLVLVSVAAWQPLYGRDDAFLLHHRRYRPSQLDRVLERAGLRIVARGGAFHSLVVPRALTVLRERVREAIGRPLPPLLESTAKWNHGRLVTRVVESALWADNTFSHAAARAGVNLPGLTCWALARREA
jgi:hypothetical protein